MSEGESVTGKIVYMSPSYIGEVLDVNKGLREQIRLLEEALSRLTEHPFCMSDGACHWCFGDEDGHTPDCPWVAARTLLTTVPETPK